jgi:plasmid stabilization system protein ParE
MGLKLIWTDFAIDQLKIVYDFYKEIANKKVAKKIIDEIYKAPNRRAKVLKLTAKAPRR